MQTIFRAIRRYAAAYSILEYLQRERVEALPRGDQKTGVIAEFYARLFAKEEFPGSRIEYGSASQEEWDIKVFRDSRKPLKIQVKAVSAYADYSRISPIRGGWNQLWLMRLDENLHPEGFWILQRGDVAWWREDISNSTMPVREKPRSGSRIYRNARDQLDQLLDVVERTRKKLLRATTSKR